VTTGASAHPAPAEPASAPHRPGHSDRKHTVVECPATLGSHRCRRGFGEAWQSCRERDFLRSETAPEVTDCRGYTTRCAPHVRSAASAPTGRALGVQARFLQRRRQTPIIGALAWRHGR
jgi:hypothetical protein